MLFYKSHNVAEFDETLLLKDFLGQSSAEEAVQISAWLDESEEHQQQYARLRMLWQARKMGAYAGNTAYIGEINEKIDRLGKSARRHSLVTFMKYAAVFVGLLTIGLLYFKGQQKPVMLSKAVSLNGNIEMVQLPDGSKVWLNNGAMLSYPEKFNKRHRTVELKGEAFFEVDKDASKRFRVETGPLTIQVTGTSFNVNTDAEGNTIETVLVSGSVTLLDKSGDAVASLKPGEMAVTDMVSGNTTVQKVNTSEYTAWQEGLVTFEKASLYEILMKIEQVYQVELTYDSIKMDKMKKHYNFVFRRSQKLDTVLDMLEYVAPCGRVKVKG